MFIKEQINGIQQTIPSHVKLVAVSKTRSIEEIRDAYKEGIRDFGENKVQELIEKVDCLPVDVNWHFIGHLQRNKVKYIVGKVYLIHSLDSIRLLEEIEKQYKEQKKIAEVLLQINIGKEPSKSGIQEEELQNLITACECCEHVKIKGLMAVIPKGNEDQCEKHFRRMKEIFDSLKVKKFKNVSMETLSIGMTGDYRIAISEGSTMIRVGEGIFGKRKYDNK